MTLTYEEFEKELSKLTIAQLKAELTRQEIQLAGFNPRHSIRPSLEMQINQIKAKIKSGADVVDWGIRSIQSLEKELFDSEKVLQGIGVGHYMYQVQEEKIRILEVNIQQKKTRN